MEIEKDTSMLNLESPKTPVANLDDNEAKTDAYSDAETIPNTDNDTQIPDVNNKLLSLVTTLLKFQQILCLP